MSHLRYGTFVSICGVITIASTSVAQDPIVQTEDFTVPHSGVGLDDDFGYALSLDYGQLLVGSPSINDENFVRPARLFSFDTTWSPAILLSPSGSGNEGSRYGYAVSILGDSSGSTAVVGAPWKTPSTLDGSIFVFTKPSGGSWANGVEFPGSAGEQFGTSLSQTTNLIAVGAPFHDSPGAVDAGAVYILEPNGSGGWVQTDTITADVPIFSEVFGSSVALFTDQSSTDWLVVAAPATTQWGGTAEVYVFKRELGGDWDAGTQLTSCITQTNAKFGHAVGITETVDNNLWIFIAAPDHDDENPPDFQCDGGVPFGAKKNGVVEVFRYFNPTWSSEEIWYAPDCLDNAYFGTSLDASGDHVAVGSYAAYSCVPDPVVIADGAGYVVNYDDPSNSWNVSGSTNKLLAHYPEGVGIFGTSITIDGDMVAVGGPDGLGGLPVSDGGQVLTYTTLLSESIDCDIDGTPDALEMCGGDASLYDCNNNGKFDACEIIEDTGLDCNHDGVLNECELADGTSLDCDGNGVPDNCDIFYGTGVDCDGNGVLDACELTNGLHLVFIVDGSGIS